MLFDSHADSVNLILDIGNGSVGGALSVSHKSGKPTLLFSMRDVFSFKEKPSSNELTKAVYDSLGVVLTEILSKGFQHTYFLHSSKTIDSVFCVLSSPWFMSQGKTISISNDKPFVITERFLDDVVDKELKNFEKEHTEISSGQASHIIEKEILALKINGYILENPIGKKADQFEVSLYVSEAEKTFTDTISSIIEKNTQVKNSVVHFYTFPHVVFSSVTRMFYGVQNYLHFDVAGEITDIALVHDGMIKKTVSYPTGSNLLVRRIAKRFDVPTEVARSYFHLFMDEKANPDIKKEIYECLQEAESEWNVYLNDALVSLCEVTKDTKEGGVVDVNMLPKKIFVTAYPRTFELFNQFLHMETTDETSQWRKGLSITYMGGEILSQFVESSPLYLLDAFLALETIFFSNKRST